MTLLMEKDILSEYEAKFYIAETVKALLYFDIIISNLINTMFIVDISS